MSTGLYDRRRESLDLLKRQYGTISENLGDVPLRETKRICLGLSGNEQIPRPMLSDFGNSALSNITDLDMGALTSLSKTNASRNLLLNATMGNGYAPYNGLIAANLASNNSISKLNYQNSISDALNSLGANQRQAQMIKAARLEMLSRSISLKGSQCPQEVPSSELLQDTLRLESAREAFLKKQRYANGNLNDNFYNSQAITDEILSTSMNRSLLPETSFIREGLAAKEPSTLTESQSDELSPITLYMPCDDNYLSEYQILLRKQIEFFQTGESELEAVAHSRQTKIKVGKVGIRCKHCAKLAPSLRPKGAVYYPGHLRALYQAAQNMAKTHFSGRCRMIDQDLQSHMQKLSTHKVAAGHVGRKYWSGCAKSIGIVEVEGGGLSFNRAAATKSVFQE